MKSDEMVSSLVFFSIGYVTINKPRETRSIQALPVESASATDGETTHSPVQEILKGVDQMGNTYEVKGTATRDLECEWFPYEDNRVTPPDVRRGELVAIYRLANTNQYFWRCMNFRNGLRTLEHVVLAFGASPAAGGSGISFDKCYTITVSPMDGHITILTTKANKEPYAYTFQINTKDGLVGLQDDVGNYIELNSKDTRLSLHNADESFLKIEKQTIEMKADRSIKFTCGGSTMEMTPESIATNTTNTTITSSGNLALKAAKSTASIPWDFI